MEMAGAHFKTDRIIVITNPLIVKWVDQNPPGRENSKMNIKKEINKTLSEASTVAASKEKWKDIVRGLRST